MRDRWSNATKESRRKPILYSVKLFGDKALVKLRDMHSEDVKVVSNALILSPEDTLLQEPTPEMRSAYVRHITSGSPTTLESFHISYLEHGRSPITTRSTKATARRSKLTGKRGSTSLSESKPGKSRLKRRET